MIEMDEDFFTRMEEMRKWEAKAKFDELVERQGVNEETLGQIRKTHDMRYELCVKMELTDNPSELVELAKQITNLDYVTQQLWGFSEDCSYHHWFDVPKCTCPKTDNMDALGSPQQIISNHCPVHFSEIMRKTCTDIENGE